MQLCNTLHFTSVNLTSQVHHPLLSPHTRYTSPSMLPSKQDTIGWQHFLKGRISKQWSIAQRACYAQRTDLDKRKYTILRWRRHLVKSIIEGSIKCWETRNQALHGDTIQASTKIRIQKLRVRVAKSYANDRLLVPPLLRNLFKMPLQHRLTHRATQLQKWLETINVAKKNQTLTAITNEIKSAFLFGKHKLHQSAHSIFNTPLRHLLRATLHDQMKWISKYNEALSSSSITIHRYLRPPGRPPGSFIPRDIIP